MDSTPPITLLDCVQQLKDFRLHRSRRHQLTDIVMITLCAIMGGCKHWEQIAAFGEDHQTWFKTFLSLPNGIPSHDTFNRIFQRLRPELLQRAILPWLHTFSTSDSPRHLAIDGKTLCGSARHCLEHSTLHLVSVWAADQRICFGQVATDQKSNEITAIPKLLQALNLRGALVTIDAMGCQKAIVETIIEQGGDYLIPVKENQPTLHAQLERAFELHTEFAEIALPILSHQTLEVNRERLEERISYQLPTLNFITCRDEWPGLKSVYMIHRERTTRGKTESEVTYYICSRVLTPEEFSQYARAHWQHENNLNWCLDVQFHEDACRVNHRQAATNLGWFRRVGVSVLNHLPGLKGALELKMQRINRDPGRLQPVLNLPILTP